MAVAQLRMVDGELFLPVSKEASVEFLLHEGSQVEVTFAPGQVRIAGTERQIPRYDLNELLDEWNQMPEEMKSYREWIDAPRVGRELI